MLGTQRADQADASDWLVSVIISAVLLVTLIGLNLIGTRVVPNAPAESRPRIFILWLCAAAFVGCFSGTTSVLYLAAPEARVLENEAVIAEAQAMFLAKSEAATEAESLLPLAETIRATAQGMYAQELANGAVSGDSSGIGRTTVELRGVETAAERATTQLIATRAEAGPLIRSGRQLLSSLRIVQSESSLSFEEKSLRIRELTAQLNSTSEELNSLIPIPLLRSLSDSLQKDWGRIGLSAQAERKLTEAFAAPARRISGELPALEAETLRKPQEVSEVEGFELIAKHSGDLAPLISVSVIIECLPILVVTLLVILVPAALSAPLPAATPFGHEPRAHSRPEATSRNPVYESGSVDRIPL